MDGVEPDRLNSEWAALSATRELMQLAMRGDQKATYAQALQLGAVIVPELLGDDVSLIKQAQVSNLAREYRQLARAKSRDEETDVDPLQLILQEIGRYQSAIAASRKSDRTDRLNRKLKLLESAEIELDPERHSEHQLIIRDAYLVDRGLPEVKIGRGHKDFELPDGNGLRIRVLHPDKPEYITGADLIYERHDTELARVSLVAIQYKVWNEKRLLYLSDDRMQGQLRKMKAFTCDRSLCKAMPDDLDFRFPFCASFLRPTDCLQAADQTLKSTGEHLSICRIDQFSSEGVRGGKLLAYDKIKKVSLSQKVFEELFSRGKIGSRSLSYKELGELYEALDVSSMDDRVVIHAQECGKHVG